ncbi:hypothetical protein [Thiosocius teredinicola]|uniref:hypothetical protein n=1 Tax=Thiosocius teredinicola TaxID=1973002 RepID=UPI000990C701
MSIWQKLRFSLSLLSELAWLLFLALSVYSFIAYVNCTDGLCHELAFAGTVSLMYAAGFALSGVLLALSVGKQLRKGHAKLLTVPVAVFLVLFVILYFGIMVYGIAART